MLAQAPGKVILFGEHAVVYGQPAIAVPLLAVRVTVTAEAAAPGSGVTIHAPEVGVTARIEPSAISRQLSAISYQPSAGAIQESPLQDALIYPVKVALRALKIGAPDVTLTVRSTIPIASGLGSGAALAAALMRAISAAAGHPLDNDTLNPLVYEVEKRHHGTPSGIDNTVIVYEKPVYFVRDQPIETFTIARPLTLLVADTGQSSPTKIAVGDVGKLYEAEPERIGAILAQIGAITRAARTAIEAGAVELLGPLMDNNHALLRDLTVSSDDLDRLCAAARQAGAPGAKLSGGGRGGNMIALVTADRAAEIAGALRRAGAVNVIQTTII
jgi:mevalonate kinase